MPEQTPPAQTPDEPSRGKETSRTLLAGLKQNRPEAWSQLDKLYKGLIHYWCVRRGVPQSDLDDISQQVYQVVIKRISEFERDRPGGSFRRWIRGITLNVLKEYFRKRQEQARAAGGTDAGRRFQELPDPFPDDEDDPEELLADQQKRALELIELEFTPRDWEIFRLLVVDELEYAEVAQRMGMKPGAVRKVMSRIGKRKRELLGEPDATGS